MTSCLHCGCPLMFHGLCTECMEDDAQGRPRAPIGSRRVRSVAERVAEHNRRVRLEQAAISAWTVLGEERVGRA